MNDVLKTIKWADKSLNPIVGCLGGCGYCYARKQAKRQKHICEKCYKFIPHTHFERLSQLKPAQKPKKIFLDSMSDFWGKGVQQKWRDRVYRVIESCPQHTFFLLTKQPQNITDVKKIPKNVWVGVSITEFDDRWRISKLLSIKNSERTFVSLEPLLSNIVSEYSYLVKWIIVGGLTGMRGFRPSKETIEEIIADSRRLKIPLFLKDNLNWHEKIQEFPKK